MSVILNTFKKYKGKHPDRLILFESGRKVSFVASDAWEVSRLLGEPVRKSEVYKCDEVFFDILALPEVLVRLGALKQKFVALKREMKPPKKWVQFSLEASPDLSKFSFAHQVAYDDALVELKEGKMVTDWVWFVFPRMEGSWDSTKGHDRGLKTLRESRLFLKRKQLADHLRESANVLLDCKGKDIINIFGLMGALHTRASATLFALTAKDKLDRELFQKILDRFFNGELDEATVKAIEDEIRSPRDNTPRDIILTDSGISIWQSKKTSQ